MKKISTLILLTASIVSCQPGKKSEIQKMKDVVISIHDEVMPKMGELRRTRRNLMLQADSLAEKDSIRISLLNIAASEIEVANEAMMEWMRSYEPEFEGTDEEILQYLEEQKVGIEEVKEAMATSLKKGKKVLGLEEEKKIILDKN